VTVLHWEEQLKTDGMDSLAEFKSLIEEANAIDPTFQAFRCPTNPENASEAKSSVLALVRRLDNLVELLERTADALAAEWDLRATEPDSLGLDDGFLPTVH
jgi:hypothetical protein